MKKKLNSLKEENIQIIQNLLKPQQKIVINNSQGSTCQLSMFEAKQIANSINKEHITHLDLRIPSNNSYVIDIILRAAYKCKTLTHLNITSDPYQNASKIDKSILKQITSIPNLKYISLECSESLNTALVAQIAQQLKTIEQIECKPLAKCSAQTFEQLVSIPSLKKLSLNQFVIDLSIDRNHYLPMQSIEILLLKALTQNTKLVISGLNNNYKALKSIALESYFANIQQILACNMNEHLIKSGSHGMKLNDLTGIGCIKASNATDLMFYLIIVLCSIFNRS